jgi:hypothetical protein
MEARNHIVDAGGRTIKGEAVKLNLGARSRIDLLKIAKQPLDHYLATLESECAEFQQKMQNYRQERTSWEHKFLKFIVTNHPDCMDNEVTDTDLDELESRQRWRSWSVFMPIHQFRRGKRRHLDCSDCVHPPSVQVHLRLVQQDTHNRKTSPGKE